MSADFDSISASAMSLPSEQRIVLANLLWDSVERRELVDAELIAEFDRRCAELDSGTAKTYTHDEVMRDVRKALGK